MDRLTGKVAVVTGVGAGIGGAIPRAFAREGADLVLVSRGGPALEETAAAVEAAGRRAIVVKGSAGERGTWEQIDAAGKELGGVDIVVNSAAFAHLSNILELTEEQWDETMQVNLKSVFYSCQMFIPQMIERGGGVFLNISSVNGLIANPSMVDYATSKSGLHGLTRNVALDFGPQGIRANVIAPGAIFTPQAEDEMDEQERRTTRDNYPMGRWGVPDDIANAAVYLVSDESSFVTGVILPVDGGLTIQTPEAAVRSSFRARWRDSTVDIND
ncbi:MAG: SDR family oxidoreductase [Microbacteriaceae bacterium]|jgi:NAD(P)-dependent dehydrogenase (short-subunit alcohol dehydrogenase family)|nr:SDR family oxidoreductase [Microbacteriaceae bacterium]HPU04763.1 SDR family oxidoreductase [Rhodoglobus sp.]